MQNKKIIGIDLGGTNVRAGIVVNSQLEKIITRKINSSGTIDEVLQQVYSIVNEVMEPGVVGIGIGVPGLVDVENNLVFDVVNIPSWKSIPLQQWMINKYNVPVQVNNDANCFALGECYFGKGRGHQSVVGITLGTGLGSGIVINNQLYAGAHCGAGEFGMVPYLDECYEYYASGQFFSNVHQTNGTEVYKRAVAGDLDALNMYAEMGSHLGNAIKMILFAIDPSCIILGGSVSNAWPFFQKSMWHSIEGFAYQRVLQKLTIEPSALQNSGILGAAALFY